MLKSQKLQILALKKIREMSDHILSKAAEGMPGEKYQEIVRLVIDIQSHVDALTESVQES